MVVLYAASYERVSSDEQAKEGFSLEVQNEKNSGYIKSQGWEYVGSYIDPGKSGKNLNRPDMKRLLADIDKGKVNIVVVHKLDRLTRNIGDLHSLLLLFDKKGIKLVSISENIDTSSAMGRMFVYMLGIFAQWYRENLSEEVLKGQTKRAESGLRNTHKPPYGYQASYDDMSLTIDPVESEVVKQIFDWFINGWGYRKIARHLNELGVMTKSSGPFYAQTLIVILHNPTYIGATHWKPDDAPEEDRIIVYDVHEAIISRDVYERAQVIAKRRSETTMNTSIYDFPFSTIVKCGECGASYIGFYKNKATGARSYRCVNKNATPNPCKSSSQITERALSAKFLQLLDDFQFNIVDQNRSLEPKDAEKERKKLSRLIDESTTKRKNYTRAMGSGKIDYDTFEELIDEENKKMQTWQSELEALGAEKVTARSVKDISQAFQNVRSKWEGMNYEEQKNMVQQLFEILVIKKSVDEWRITNFKLAD